MDIIKVAVLGIIAVFLSLQFKQTKAEYGGLIVMLTGMLVFYFGIRKMGTIFDAIHLIKGILGTSAEYIQLLLKMIGIAFLCDFSADLCKDNGHQALANQIHIFGKICVLAMCTPVITRLFDIIEGLV